MDPLTPWLLLMVAALIVACVSLYYQLRQSESQSRGQQSILSDELRDAEAALLSALDRLREMDESLAQREASLREGTAAPGSTASTAAVSFERAERVDPKGEGIGAPTEREAPHAAPSRREATSPADLSWRERTVALGRAGLTPAQIARELELPVGEVELVLSLAVVSPGGSAG